MTTFRDLELLVGCERCGAHPGDMCTTRSGRRANLVHAVRAEPVYAAWRVGFVDGQRDIVAAIDSPDSWSHGYIDQVRQAMQS